VDYSARTADFVSLCPGYFLSDSQSLQGLWAQLATISSSYPRTPHLFGLEWVSQVNGYTVYLFIGCLPLKTMIFDISCLPVLKRWRKCGSIGPWQGGKYCSKEQVCGPYRTRPRTFDALFAKLKLFFSSNHAPELWPGAQDAAGVTD